jgi:hypothetical protein
MAIADWLPPVMVGTTFTAMGILKMYGLLRGVVRGRDKPWLDYLCATPPDRLGRAAVCRRISPFFFSASVWAASGGSCGSAPGADENWPPRQGSPFAGSIKSVVPRQANRILQSHSRQLEAGLWP